MTMDIKPQDEVVRIDRRPGEISFAVRRPDRSLSSVKLFHPIWTHIEEIGFRVREVVVSDPDRRVLEEIKSRRPQLSLPEGLRQLRLMDHEGAKISVIFSNEAPTSS